MKNNKNIFIIMAAVIGMIIGGLGLYYGTTELGWFSKTVVNKLEKEVTINESGIADSVDKLYDAVVVVGALKEDKLSSSGTGFVYKVDDKKAYIITNAHVVSGGNSVKVQFTDGNTYDVELVGQDEYADIAVLSIDKEKKLLVAELGSSEEARLGDTLFTIGAPLDSEYSWTVTRGILSGKDRLVEVGTGNSNVANWVMSVLQTDAAINSGNSGGPIANSNGEVIGVTNMKLVSSGVEGIGFAIPIEDAINYANQLIENKEIIRPILGVGTLNVTDVEALQFQYSIKVDSSITSGAVVAYVQAGSPAAEAGFEKGDVITKFGDYDITSSAKLKYYLYKYQVGDKIKVSYKRGTKTTETTVNLNERAS
ncbi:MAG: trypsin-like peptidase domain-containing protein [Bacilli bacterium]|nr:trypsin-like peptidase domain-containing protein [Bacilli bacterium]